MRVVAGGVGRALYVKVEKGEDPFDVLKRVAKENAVGFAYVVGLGGFRRVRLGLFSGGAYEERVVEAEEGKVLEAIGLTGNLVTGPGGEVYPHLHVSVARRQDEVYAGHLLGGTADPFLELLVVEVQAPAEDVRELFKHRWAR